MLKPLCLPKYCNLKEYKITYFSDFPPPEFRNKKNIPSEKHLQSSPSFPHLPPSSPIYTLQPPFLPLLPPFLLPPLSENLIVMTASSE